MTTDSLTIVITTLVSALSSVIFHKNAKSHVLLTSVNEVSVHFRQMLLLIGMFETRDP